METAAIAVIILGISSGFTDAVGVLPDLLNAAVGGRVNFTTTLSPTEIPFSSVTWWFGDSKIFPSDTGPDPGYTDRITFFPSTGSLELRSLALGDSGEYRVVVIPHGEPMKYGSTRLQVYEPITAVTAHASTTDLIEFSSVRLSCSSSGSSLFFLWMNDSSEVTASDRVQLTDGGSTLTITNVTRYDQGPYSCLVDNPVSNGRSDQTNLSISFGPESTSLQLSPSQQYFAEGSDLIMSCSADSRPAAVFYWWLDGERLSDTGPELALTNIHVNQSGNYSCQAFNSKTLNELTSQISNISVLERISGAFVKPSTNLMIEGNYANLTCDAAGSAFTRKWIKDGSNMTLPDNIKFYDGKKILSFQPLTKNDSGEYSCRVSNPVSNEEVKYITVVNYGPENVQIKGPSEIVLDQVLTLTCSAESTPSASYTWILNGSEIYYLAVYIKNDTKHSDSGNYTCKARNRITGRTLYAVHGLTVSAHRGLSAGAIAGIIMACLVVALCFTAGGYFIYKKKVQKHLEGPREEQNMPMQQEQPNHEEHIYENVSFSRKRNA